MKFILGYGITYNYRKYEYLCTLMGFYEAPFGNMSWVPLAR